MCGIVTMLCDSTTYGNELRSKILSQAIMMDTLRGDHSTGVACVDPKQSVQILKEAVPGYDFIESKEYDELMKNKFDYVIAHNRYATAGVINALNAHPFSHDNITGVHNGTVYDCEPADLRYRTPDKDQKFETDSEHLIHGLSTNSTEEIVSNIDGAFVLVWHNADTNTIHFVRNKERPFYIAHCTASNFVFGMSEEMMLHSLLLRNNIYTYNITELPVGKEYIYSKDDLFNPEIRDHEVLDWYDWGKWNYNQSYSTHTKRQPKAEVIDIKKSGTQSSDGSTYNNGDTVTVNIVGWEKYKNDYGYVHGYVQGTDQAVRFSRISKEAYDTTIDESRTVTARVKGMFWLTDHKRARDDKNRQKVYSLNFSTIQPVYEMIEPPFDYDPSDDIHDDYYVKDGICVPTQEAERLIKDGCHSCSDPLYLSEFNDLDWLQDSPICCNCDINWYLN